MVRMKGKNKEPFFVNLCLKIRMSEIIKVSSRL